MNFLSKKVLEIQKRKLDESEKKLLEIRIKIKRLEENNDEIAIINNEKKLEKIWESNIIKIKKEIDKIEKHG
ncbi:MAG: hypothetical protein ACW9WZ_01195 [Nitrosopumilus sp.]